jgi:glutathione S-transferase
MRLIVIAPSHYCEKAAWALDRAQFSYEYQALGPGFHRAAIRKAGGKGTAPALVHPGGILDDSTDILRWIHTQPGSRFSPYPEGCAAEALAWEERFDAELGPHTRRFAYHHLLPHKGLLAPALTEGIPAGQARLVRWIWPLLVFSFRRSMRIDAQGAARSEAKIRTVFEAVAEALGDGRPYLCGDQFSAADLSFAALAAPVLLPPEYGPTLPSLESLPSAVAASLRQFREHPAGLFGLRLYAKERPALRGTPV